MKLLTASGQYETAGAGAIWPVPSAVVPAPQGWQAIELSSGAGGKPRNARLAEIYRTNPWVWTCVKIKAGGVSRLPLHTFAFDGEGNRERVRPERIISSPGATTGPEQLARILERPVGLSRRAWINRTLVDKGVYGNAVSEVVRNGRGVPIGLRYHRWGTITPHLSDDGARVEALELPDKRMLSPRDVIHFANDDDPDSPLGVSPIQTLRYTNALYDALGRYLRAWFGNQAAPSGHVKLPQGATPDEAARVRQMISDYFSSPDNAGKVLTTTGDWQKVGEAPNNNQVIDLIKLSREEVCAAYGIPTPIAGILDRAIMANVTAMREQYVRDVLGPESSAFEDELMSQLVLTVRSWEHAFVEFQLAEQLRPDMKARAEAYERELQWRTIDEIRTTENLPPLEIEGVTDVPILKPGTAPAGEAADVDGDSDEEEATAGAVLGDVVDDLDDPGST